MQSSFNQNLLLLLAELLIEKEQGISGEQQINWKIQNTIIQYPGSNSVNSWAWIKKILKH